MAHLVVGHQLLLKLSEHRIFLLTAGDDELKGGEQVLLAHPRRRPRRPPQGGLVHQAGQIRTRPRGRAIFFRLTSSDSLDLPVWTWVARRPGQVWAVDGEVPKRAGRDALSSTSGRLVAPRTMMPCPGRPCQSASSASGSAPSSLPPMRLSRDLPMCRSHSMKMIQGAILAASLNRSRTRGRAHAYEHLHKRSR